MPGRSDELAALGGAVVGRLDEANSARETALAACRRTIQAASGAIRAVHRREWERADELAAESGAALRRAQEALAPYPALAAAGPLHDAAKEYAEARLTAALAGDRPLPPPDELGVTDAAWLNGLAEAASELRRHLLDCLRLGDIDRGNEMLDVMADVYDMLVSIEPDGAFRTHMAQAT